MDWYTLGALVWLAISLWAGYRKGFWKSFAALASLLGAYWFSIVAARPVAHWAAAKLGYEEQSPWLVWAISAAVLFILAGFILRFIIALFAKALPRLPSALNRAGGATLGFANGVLIAVGAIWSLAFLQETLAYKAGVSDPAQVWGGRAPQVVLWSRALMSRAAGFAYDSSELNDTTVALTEAFLASPTGFVDDLKRSAASSEFRDLVQNKEVATLVRERDIEGVLNSPSFQEFIAVPETQELARKLSGNERFDEREFANTVVDIWAQVDHLQNQPEFQELMHDEEIRNYLNGQVQLNASLLKKAQKFLNLLAANNADKN